MSDVTLSISVPKELNDVLQSVVTIVTKVKAGDASQPLVFLASELGDLVRLLGEFQALPAEVKAEQGASVDCVLLAVRQIVSVLLAK